MSKSNNIIGALTNKGTSVFRETFQHSTKDVTHYFPGHMARGEHIHHITSHHLMENTEAGLQRPLFLRNRLKTTSI